MFFDSVQSCAATAKFGVTKVRRIEEKHMGKLIKKRILPFLTKKIEDKSKKKQCTKEDSTV